jgi:hypothetical protein
VPFLRDGSDLGKTSTARGINEMKRWEQLPEWARWILCWPLIFVFTIVAGLFTSFLASVALARSPIPQPVATALYPALATLVSGPIFFLLIHALVPRKQTWVTGFFVFVSTSLGLMAGITWCFAFMGGNIHPTVTFQEIAQTITAVAVSWYWFLRLRAHLAQPSE